MTHRLRCFGRLAIEDEGGERVQLRSRKHLALLVYLAAHPDRRHERGRLAGLFWDTEPDLARHSLSQALYDLGKHLPDLDLDRTNREVGLGPSGLVYGGRAFEEAVREDRLDEAVRLYEGPFAPDLETVGGRDFERWVERERTRFRSLAEKALLRQVSACADAGRWGEMVVAGNRLVDMNPLSEDAHRAVMKGLWLRGDRSAALAHFQEHEDFLEEELPGGVSAETRELIEKIRSADRAGGGRTVRERPRPEMVGREEEFRVLKDALADVMEGESRFIVIRGEAGIGKTRLLEEFAEVAALEDVRLLQSRCYAAESDVPYGPIVDGLRELAQEFAEAAEAEETTFYQLGHLFPEVFGKPEAEEIYTRPDAATRRLAEEFVMLFRLASRKSPVIWLIDDAHWVDSASRSLVSHLASRMSGRPVAVLQALRPSETENSGSGSRRGSSWRYVDMSPLDEPALKKLVAQSRSNLISRSGELDRLMSLTGGNPFYTLEILENYDETGLNQSSPFPQNEQWAFAADIEHILEARLQNHSSEAIQVLRAIAVAGRHAQPKLIASVTGLSLNDLAKISSDLYQSGVIYDRENSLAFRHDLIRHYVYANAGGLTRSTMHLAIAEALEDQSGVEPAPLAKHYFQAGEAKKAFEYAYTAAKEAGETYAHDEALEFLNIAVSSAQSDEDRARAEALQAKVQFGTGRYSQAIAASRNALESNALSSSKSLDLKLLQGRALVEMGDWKRAERHLRNLQAEEFEDSLSNRLKFRWSHYLLLKRAVRLNDPELAKKFRRYIDNLQSDIATRQGDDPPPAYLEEYTLEKLTIAGYNLFYRDVRLADSAIHQVEPHVAKLPFDLRHQVYSLGTIVACRLAEWDRAVAFTRRGGHEAEKLNDLSALTMAYLNQSVIEMERGNFEDAEDLLRQCKKATYIDRGSNHVALVATNIGDQYFYTEHYKDALEAYREAIDLSKRNGFSYLLPELYASLGLALLAEGRADDAKEVASNIEATDYLGGVQDRYKIYWLRAYWEIIDGERQGINTLREYAESEYKTDVPSAAKAKWLADLFETSFVLAQNGSGPSKKPGYLGDRSLGWFAYHTRRWLQRVRAKN